MSLFPNIEKQDPEVLHALLSEEERQTNGIELIPSENYVSQAILEANGSILTNKYSEGYPGKRYYGGQENIDTIETLAVNRAKELFNAEHVNVQPYSGSPANTAIYFALLEYGDTVLGLKLDHGGHITHGLPIGFSGKSYNFIPYTVNRKTGLIDMDEVYELAKKHKPKMIVAGFTAYSRDLDWKLFKKIADEVGALTMADISHISGLIAGGVLESPVPYFDVVMTTTHKTLRGPRSAIIMCKEQFGKAIDKAIFPGLQGGPHDQITASKAICFKEAMRPEFKDYATQIIKNAQVLGKELIKRDYKILTGGTDNHLLLVDLTNKGVTGQQAQNALDIAEITLNKNTVPYDPRSPFDPSGIRFGTPAVTTRGMKEAEMIKIAEWMDRALQNHDDEAMLKDISEEVSELCKKFPIPGIKI